MDSFEAMYITTGESGASTPSPPSPSALLEDMDTSEPSAGQLQVSHQTLFLIIIHYIIVLMDIDKHEATPFLSNILHIKDDHFILSRFQQDPTIHKELEKIFYTEQGKKNMLNYLESHYCTFYKVNSSSTGKLVPLSQTEKKQLDNFPTTMNDLFNTDGFLPVNIRFASFIIIPGNTPQIFLTETNPFNGIYCINLYSLAMDGRISSDTLVTLAKKVIIEYRNIFRLEEPKNKWVLFNLDLYYSRPRTRAGLFHIDKGPGFGNFPDFISLEYFFPKDFVILGPEVVQIDPKKMPTTSHTLPEKATLGSDGLRKPSIRVLLGNGSIVTFNNKKTIHASPLLKEDYTDTMDAKPFPDFIGEKISPPHTFASIVKSTSSLTRSFIRTHIQLIKPDAKSFKLMNILTPFQIHEILELNTKTFTRLVLLFRTFKPIKNVKGQKTRNKRRNLYKHTFRKN